MKVDILGLDGKKSGTIELPDQFSEEIREDLIRKAVLAVQSHKRQSYGAGPRSGKRHSTWLAKRRRDFKASYGPGRSRTPRKTMSRSGTQFHMVGAWAPFTRGGRRAHPPKGEANWDWKLNIKERRKAIRSAIAATLDKLLVVKRGHRIENVPLIIDSKFENVDKTKDVKKILENIGLKKELDRISVIKIRAGKGKKRGRKYKTKVGPLIVISKDCKLVKSASNIIGVDVVNVKKLNAEILAPGTQPGRLTIYTEEAIKIMNKENLFFDKK